MPVSSGHTGEEDGVTPTIPATTPAPGAVTIADIGGEGDDTAI